MTAGSLVSSFRIAALPQNLAENRRDAVELVVHVAIHEHLVHHCTTTFKSSKGTAAHKFPTAGVASNQQKQKRVRWHWMLYQVLRIQSDVIEAHE